MRYLTLYMTTGILTFLIFGIKLIMHPINSKCEDAFEELMRPLLTILSSLSILVLWPLWVTFIFLPQVFEDKIKAKVLNFIVKHFI